MSQEVPTASQAFAGTGENLLTVEEVAEFLHVSVSWVYERTRKRTIERIPGFRLGKYWRFRRGDVLTWIDKQKIGIA